METTISNFEKIFSLVENYLAKDDLSRHNANLIYGLPAMAGIIFAYVQKEYYLNKILNEEERLLHEEGWWYHHQMSMLSPYCAGFSAVDIMKHGLQSLNSFFVKSKPPKHLKSFLDQSANFILKVSQEISDAVALNDLTTVAAAYVWYERQKKDLTYDEIKNAFQSFVYNVNLDFRSGNSPFTNVTVTIGGPAPALVEEPIIIGRKYSLSTVTFSVIPKEIYDEVNMAFFEVMARGDSEGKPWTFPLITVYITDDFDWNSPVFNALLDLMDNFGGVYLENYVSKPFMDKRWREKVENLEARDPKLQRSFCCRFQVDLQELTKVPHTGSIFGNVSGVGSIGVITINFNRLGYLHKGDVNGLTDHQDFLLEKARTVLNKKRKFILEHEDLYPTFFYYVDRSLNTYFNTISLGGGHEGLINFGIKDGILSDEGLQLAKIVAGHILEKIREFQEEDGIAWNFEYAPMETAAGYLAKKKRMIISYNEFDLGKAYSTLSSAIYPVGFLNIRKLLSITVPEDYSNPDPITEIKVHKALDVSTLVFITAAKNYEFFESNGIKYFVSLGINGTGKHAGRTINTAVFINKPLSINDLVEIVKVITEAKCGAPMDYGLRITGTVTDAVAAGTYSLSEKVRFTGTATPLGSEVGREVYISVMRVLEKDLKHF